MKATWLYRIAAILLVLFAAAHTIGFLKFVPPTSEGKAAMDAMNTVSLQPGTVYTYGDFYRGFGLFVTVCLLFAAFLAWHLGELARKLPAAAGWLPWIFFCVQLASLAITWRYFPAPPIVSSALVALCVGLAAVLARSGSSPTSSERT
jgi:hypothetical protein